MNALDACLFDLTENGTIIVPDLPEPKHRADVYDHIDPDDIHSCASLINVIKNCPPLTHHIRLLSQQYLEQHAGVDAFIQSIKEPSAQRSARQTLILKILRRDTEDGWEDWITYSGDEGLQDFLEIVRVWLGADINWTESEHFTAPWNGQEIALRYFETLPSAFLTALGVEIVEGDCPGSTYNAARLLKSRKDFNRVAELLSIYWRFRAANYKEIMEALHA